MTPKRLSEIKAIRDEDIDTSDIPAQGEGFFKQAKLVQPSPYRDLARQAWHAWQVLKPWGVRLLLMAIGMGIMALLFGGQKK